MKELAQTYLSIEEIDVLARALLALAVDAPERGSMLDAHGCATAVWRASKPRHRLVGPLATHLAELRSQLEALERGR